MTRLELGIAWRYLRSRSGSRLLSFISVIAIGGVMVGVSALIIIIGVMNGLQNDLRDKILIASPDIRVLTLGDLKMKSWKSVLSRVRTQPGVAAAAPVVLAQGGVTAGQAYGDGVMIVGIEPAGPGAADVTSIRQHIVAGQGDFRFASADGLHRGIVLGRRLADKLGVFPGDKVMLVSIAGLQVNEAVGSFVPRFEPFQVTGIFDTGMYEYDDNYVYVALDAAQQLAGLGDAVTGIEVRTSDRWAAPRVAVQLADSLGFPYRAVDWQQNNAGLFSALKLEKFAMGVILLLIVVVAAFNIVSTLSMVVKDKTREIGILKAMGMTGGGIRRIFFAQGIVIGLVGTLLGLLVGIGISLAIDRYRFISLDPAVYFIDHLPVTLEVTDVTLIVLASMAIAALATWYPSWQAARLYPVEAIRQE